MHELTERFGVRPRLTWYDTHVTVDNLKGETRVDGKALATRTDGCLTLAACSTGAGLVPLVRGHRPATPPR